MKDELRAEGGLCAPVGPYEPHIRHGDIWWHDNQYLRPFRRFFTWDKGWGFPLRGGPFPKVRDLLPVFSTTRGAITYSSTE